LFFRPLHASNYFIIGTGASVIQHFDGMQNSIGPDTRLRTRGNAAAMRAVSGNVQPRR